MADNRPPWIKFVLDDWCQDPNLKLCPLDVAGWYLRLMSVLSRADLYGKLSVNGAEPTPQQLARLTEADAKVCARCLATLKEAGVLKKGMDGFWYQERMVKDWLEYAKSKASGEEGARARWGSDPNTPPHEPPPHALDIEEEREVEVEEEKEFPPKILELTELFRSLILQRKPDRKLATSWDKNTASAIDRMIRLDGRNLEQVERVIKWCQGNDFWWKNILSGEKLREKFDQLEADMGVESKPKPQGPVDDLERAMIPLNGKNYTQKQIDDLIAVDQVVRTQSGYRFTTPPERERALELKEQARQIASARSVT